MLAVGFASGNTGHIEMRKLLEPIELILHHDVLCAWCALADLRLGILKEELGDAIQIEYQAFTLRPEERTPSKREIQAEISALRKVSQEREARSFVSDLWRSSDPPRSSMPPLAALEAARIIGGKVARDRLLAAMRIAAFRHGLNITRDDVLIELAERCGLDTGRFATALGAQGTRRLVSDQHDAAAFRGIESLPALTIGGEWLVTGAQPLDEYRRIIKRFGEQNGLFVPERMVH